jgi:hypothetical protein
MDTNHPMSNRFERYWHAPFSCHPGDCAVTKSDSSSPETPRQPRSGDNLSETIDPAGIDQ